MSLCNKERANHPFKDPVVVMADVNKKKLDYILENHTDDIGIHVMARQGCPYDVNDLHKVSAQTARTIIWLEPDEEESEVLI